MLPVHLIAHLQGVAAVGEDRRFFRQHRRRARRPLKAVSQASRWA
jgi:hypothetical protein